MRLLWCRPASTALIRPLAWGPPYATGAALENIKKKKKERKKKRTQTGWNNERNILAHINWHIPDIWLASSVIWSGVHDIVCFLEFLSALPCSVWWLILGLAFLEGLPAILYTSLFISRMWRQCSFLQISNKSSQPQKTKDQKKKKVPNLTLIRPA